MKLRKEINQRFLLSAFMILIAFSFILSSCKKEDQKIEICDNGIDDDNDGFIDCDDFDCEGNVSCPVEICDNGIDDDGDGFIDCDDFDCAGFVSCL